MDNQEERNCINCRFRTPDGRSCTNQGSPHYYRKLPEGNKGCGKFIKKVIKK